MHLIGFYDYTVLLTYLSLISSMIGILCASRGHFIAAVCCLMLSGVCDMFDGIVARTKKDRTADQKNFGIQLDSLCDVVCFGVFPAILLYTRGVDSTAGIVFLIFYVLCAVIRLAFFNVLETKRQMTECGCAKEYRGLPVTTSAIIFPLFFLIGTFLPEQAAVTLYYVLVPVVGLLFILDFRVPKIDYVALLKGKKSHQKVG